MRKHHAVLGPKHCDDDDT